METKRRRKEEGDEDEDEGYVCAAAAIRGQRNLEPAGEPHESQRDDGLAPPVPLAFASRNRADDVCVTAANGIDKTISG